MIPTFNCAHLLGETLESVLSQGIGPEDMQIEVIDDCSTKDDPAAIAESIGRGRVAFFRQPNNQGVTRNFNTCVQRARGELIHILHGDDLVSPGFYCAIEALSDNNPNAALLATRAFHIDEQSEILDLNDRIYSMASFSNDPAPFFYNNPFRTPAMVVRRSFYEEYGGFNETLCHTADWELWVRAIAARGGIVLNQPLAKYRWFAANDTSRLMRTGENLRDFLRMAEIFKGRYPAFDMMRFRHSTSVIARRQARLFAERGDLEASAANSAICQELSKPPMKALRRLEFTARHRVIRPLLRAGRQALQKIKAVAFN